ncbi:hypothetical protein ACR9VJ_26475 [Streptomyces sp. H49]|uniref:hypothetical protein n=1 Tax=Streptomyces sp. H49 TaxID=3444117 RepID=UPI003F4ADA71
MIKLTVQGTVYEFDGDHLLLAEAREIKTHAKMSVPKWMAGIDEGDPDALQALIYLAKKRAGESLRFSDLDTLDYADIDLEPVDDETEEKEEQGAAQAPVDPTPSGDTGMTQTPGSTGTSAPSPTTSSTTPETSAV